LKKYINGVSKAAKDPTSLGNILVESHVVDLEDLQKAIRFQQENQDVMLGEALVRLGVLQREVLDALLLQQKIARGKEPKKAIGQLVELARKKTEETTTEMQLVCAAMEVGK
jgi:hypothetical protein